MTGWTETYIGDGVYARFDGYGVELRAPREHGDHTIVLEPDVLASLIEYLGTLHGSMGEAPILAVLRRSAAKLPAMRP